MEGVFRDGLMAGKTALITGGSSGINLGIAERFAQMGAQVAIIGRKPDKLAAAVARLERHGAKAMGLSCDVRDFPAMEQAFTQVHEAFGPLDVLVCGAAGNFPVPAVGMSANAFKSVVDIDLLGTFNACRAGFERMRAPGASVLAISAPQATQPTAMQSHVCAAKAGVERLAQTLAIEWGGSGIRVNAISPGPIEGTEGVRRLAPTEDAQKKVKGLLPLGRFGTAEEIADLALFLCSDAARYITGVVVPCDGGQSLIGSGALLSVLMGG